jgi:hypothetical protein
MSRDNVSVKVAAVRYCNAVNPKRAIIQGGGRHQIWLYPGIGIEEDHFCRGVVRSRRRAARRSIDHGHDRSIAFHQHHARQAAGRREQ